MIKTVTKALFYLKANTPSDKEIEKITSIKRDYDRVFLRNSAYWKGEVEKCAGVYSTDLKIVSAYVNKGIEAISLDEPKETPKAKAKEVNTETKSTKAKSTKKISSVDKTK